MPRPTPDQVADEVFSVVSALKRRVRGETGNEKMSNALRSALHRVEGEGPLTTADLARAELITPQTAGAFIAQLEAEGYVRKRDDADDGRRRLIELTSTGRKALADARAGRRSWFAQRIADRLDPTEQRTLLAALVLLRRLIGS